MTVQPNELIGQLAAIQEGIWQKVSVTVSEASGQAITFANPLTVQANSNELFEEFQAPVLAVQFGFGSMPEHQQVVLFPQDTFSAFASLVKQAIVEALDENVVAEIRPALEALVQGVCLAVGERVGEPVVATGLTLRFQAYAFPPNMQRSEDLVRTQIALSGEDLSGSAVWLMDMESAAYILGAAFESSDGSPFSAIQDGASIGTHPLLAGEVNGLDLVRDIPLEISVELGRVKMLVRDVLELGTGSIVAIDKSAGEPVDVMVNGLKVARGEVVVIEDNFGVRITEVINPNDRLNALGEVA